VTDVNDETRKEEVKNQTIEENDEWSELEKISSVPPIETDFEHKIWLITPESKQSLIDKFLKELVLSNIDEEYAYILINYLDIINTLEEMGMEELAIKKLNELRSRLLLQRSIGGVERLLQSGEPLLRASIERGKRGRVRMEEDEQEPGWFEALKGKLGEKLGD